MRLRRVWGGLVAVVVMLADIASQASLFTAFLRQVVLLARLEQAILSRVVVLARVSVVVRHSVRGVLGALGVLSGGGVIERAVTCIVLAVGH